MKTLTLKTNLTKAIVLSALTIAPALALTNSAQAAPSHRAPATPTWNSTDNRNNDSANHNSDNRFDDHCGNTPSKPTHQVPPVQAPRFDPHSNPGYGDNRNNAPRYDDHRSDNRNAPRYDDHRDNDNRDRDHNNGKSNTGKIIGAGIIGAILGAVLSH